MSSVRPCVRPFVRPRFWGLGPGGTRAGWYAGRVVRGAGGTREFRVVRGPGGKLLRSALIFVQIAASCIDWEANCCVLHRFGAHTLEYELIL